MAQFRVFLGICACRKRFESFGAGAYLAEAYQLGRQSAQGDPKLTFSRLCCWRWHPEVASWASTQ